MAWPNFPYNDSPGATIGRVAVLSESESVWVVNFGGMPAFARVSHPDVGVLSVTPFEIAYDLYRWLPSNSFPGPPQLAVTPDGVPVFLHRVEGGGWGGTNTAAPMVLYSLPTGSHVDLAAAKLVLFTDYLINVPRDGLTQSQWDLTTVGKGEGTLLGACDAGVVALAGDGYQAGGGGYAVKQWLQVINSDCSFGAKFQPTWMQPRTDLHAFPTNQYVTYAGVGVPGTWVHDPDTGHIMAWTVKTVPAVPFNQDKTYIVVLDAASFEIVAEKELPVSFSEVVGGIVSVAPDQWVLFAGSSIWAAKLTGTSLVLKQTTASDVNARPYGVAAFSPTTAMTWSSLNETLALDNPLFASLAAGVYNMHGILGQHYRRFDWFNDPPSEEPQQAAWAQTRTIGSKIKDLPPKAYLALLHDRPGFFLAQFDTTFQPAPSPHTKHDRVMTMQVPAYKPGAARVRLRQRDDGGRVVSEGSNNPSSRQGSGRVGHPNTYW